MLPLTPPKTLKHVGEKLRGKMRRYRLVRNNGHLVFTGSLLSVFRHQDAPEPMPPGCGFVDVLAVFRTKAGRYLVYYIVASLEHDELTIRHEYARVCPDLVGVRDFFAAMTYPNMDRFVPRVLTECGLLTEESASPPMAEEAMETAGEPAVETPPEAIASETPPPPESPPRVPVPGKIGPGKSASAKTSDAAAPVAEPGEAPSSPS